MSSVVSRFTTTFERLYQKQTPLQQQVGPLKAALDGASFEDVKFLKTNLEKTIAFSHAALLHARETLKDLTPQVTANYRAPQAFCNEAKALKQLEYAQFFLSKCIEPLYQAHPHLHDQARTIQRIYRERLSRTQKQPKAVLDTIKQNRGLSASKYILSAFSKEESTLIDPLIQLAKRARKLFPSIRRHYKSVLQFAADFL